MKIKELVSFLDHRYQIHIHDEIDQGKLGLQIGDFNDDVTKVLLTLDVTTEVIDEAIQNHCNLIISHHPVVFYPLLTFVEHNQTAKIVRKLIENKINVYNMHTNLDIVDGGVNDALAAFIGLKAVHKVAAEKPELEMMRIGFIDETTLQTVANHLKNLCNIPLVKVIGNMNKKIKSVAIVGGAGSDIETQNRAKSLDVDVYISSEIKHHEALHANLIGLAMIEIPHSAEFVYHMLVKKELETLGIPIIVSGVKQDPFSYV